MRGTGLGHAGKFRGGGGAKKIERNGKSKHLHLVPTFMASHKKARGVSRKSPRNHQRREGGGKYQTNVLTFPQRLNSDCKWKGSESGFIWDGG